MKFSDNISGKQFSKDPSVIKFDNKYFMYYSVPPAINKKDWYIGIATSDDLENWQIIDYIKPTQKCEMNGICAAGAIVINNKVHIFYQTYGNANKDCICHAVSQNGIDFEKDKTNPVFKPNTNWCCGRAIDADVCIFNKKLYMYFATRDENMEIQKIGGAYADMASDFSLGQWTPIADRPLLSPELKWEGKCIEAPACICHDKKLYMFYGGSYNCTPQQIGCAVSVDGKNFSRISKEPFLKNGKPGEWNESESGHPFVFKDKDKIYLFFQGNSDNGNTWFISKKEISFIDGIPMIHNN